jgi:hypothetical protein
MATMTYSTDEIAVHDPVASSASNAPSHTPSSPAKQLAAHTRRDDDFDPALAVQDLTSFKSYLEEEVLPFCGETFDAGTMAIQVPCDRIRIPRASAASPGSGTERGCV